MPGRFRMSGVTFPIPSLSLALIFLSLLMAALGECVSGIEARGQTPARNTASWYADNPKARVEIVAICRDDPAMAMTNGDCINASMGQIIAMEREGRRRINLYPMSDRRYWLNEPPHELWKHLSLCRTMTPEQRRFNHCSTAERV